MSEQTDSTTVTEETNESQGQDFEAITSQDALDRIIQARIARERAKFADYEELKAKADKLSEFEESQKTEAQKAQERLEAAERRAAELELKADRAEVAAVKGVPAELLSGSTREELEASADALIAFRGEVKPAQLQPIPGEGAVGPLPLNGDGIESALKNALGIR